MSRAFLFVMDSVGIGGAPDAAKFGDAGSNTLGHISDHMNLKIPNLVSLGVARAVKAASGSEHGLDANAPVKGGWGYAVEVSQGKDTITGHWEMGGVPLQFAWGYFPQTIPAFPQSLMDEIITRAKLPGLLCIAHASGTQVKSIFVQASPSSTPVLIVLFKLLLMKRISVCSDFMTSAKLHAS
jgi:phosphopentomutase